jgi:hypothetical protein
MIFPAVPTPAQLITPPRGALVERDQAMMLFMVERMDDKEVMSVRKCLT